MAKKRKNYSTEELCITCEAWTENGNTFHHVKSRGSGGPELPWNEMPLCSRCHNEAHSCGGTKSFAEKYPQVRAWLINNGWEFLEFNEKWVHLKGGAGAD